MKKSLSGAFKTHVLSFVAGLAGAAAGVGLTYYPAVQSLRTAQEDDCREIFSEVAMKQAVKPVFDPIRCTAVIRPAFPSRIERIKVWYRESKAVYNYTSGIRETKHTQRLSPLESELVQRTGSLGLPAGCTMGTQYAPKPEPKEQLFHNP